MTRNEIAQIILVEAMKQKVCCYGDFSDEDYKGVGLDGIFDLLAIADEILSALEVPCHIQSCSTLESPSTDTEHSGC